MSMPVKPDPTSPTFRKKSPSSQLRCDRRKGRTSKRKSVEKLLENRIRTPEQTEAGRRHAALWKAWMMRMDRETFVAFITSPYC